MQCTGLRISENLIALRPMITALCKVAGTPGLAIGVIHEGKFIHEDYFGYRDVQAKLKPDRDTVFFVASLTKAITAAALGMLVNDGLLKWTTPVHEILLEMSRSTMLCRDQLSVIDLLSHRTGVAWSDALYLQSNNNILLPKSECIRTFDYLPVITPPGSTYMYNNYGYNIAGLVVEKLSGKDWGEFVKERIFQPLSMTRTFTEHPDDPNVHYPTTSCSTGFHFRSLSVAPLVKV